MVLNSPSLLLASFIQLIYYLGYNHSGRLGTVNFLYGLMGIANAQRALDYIRTITEFIAQPEWAPLFPIWGIVNEALEQTIGMDILTTLYAFLALF